jgi:hypothetical protein
LSTRTSPYLTVPRGLSNLDDAWLQRCRPKTVVVTNERNLPMNLIVTGAASGTVAKAPRLSSLISIRRVQLLLRPNSAMWTCHRRDPGGRRYGGGHRCFWGHRHSGQQRRHPDGGTARLIRLRQVEAATVDPFGRRILDHPRRAAADVSPRHRRQHYLLGFGAFQGSFNA